MRNKKFDIIVRVTVLILSIIFLIIGNKIATKDLHIFQNDFKSDTVAKVIEISDRKQVDGTVNGQIIGVDIYIFFKCEILNGENKGEIVDVIQRNDALNGIDLKEVEVGDKVMIFDDINMENSSSNWTLIDYYRIDGIVYLAVIFCIMVILITRRRGINILLTLALTCTVVFFVFIPSILTGANIYNMSLITCLYVIVSTLLILNGPSKKTLATVVGCFSGVIVAGIIAIVMDYVLKLTGVVDEHSIYLTLLETSTPINLRAIIFAAIIIGSLGAVMDVAMDISSALYEISENVDSISFRKLYKSGMTIGNDIMGTMANTLVLAYIGSSLSSILLILVNSSSALQLLNRECIITEILQALVGSMGLLITIPLTTCVCSLLYRKVKENKISN